MQYRRRCSEKKAKFTDKKGDACLGTPVTVEGDWETRQAFIQTPWSKPPKVYMEEREQARKTHERIWLQHAEPVQLYTDGSGYLGGIRGSSVPGIPKHPK